MPRPPRLEYPGALYHVTARGVQQSAIFLDDRDRSSLLAIVGRVLPACQARAFAFCLMGNHYHFVLQTRLANLSALMQRINGAYCLTFNQRHSRRGHVFEGRFKALHVDRDNYLLEVCRYVELNPVRAGLVALPSHWGWSSHGAHIGLSPTPRWLASAELLGALTGAVLDRPSQLVEARRRYADWVESGRDVRLWKDSLREGRCVGDAVFLERVKEGRAGVGGDLIAR